VALAEQLDALREQLLDRSEELTTANAQLKIMAHTEAMLQGQVETLQGDNRQLEVSIRLAGYFVRNVVIGPFRFRFILSQLNIFCFNFRALFIVGYLKHVFSNCCTRKCSDNFLISILYKCNFLRVT
jgi:hypothetical protein